jgi:hypothetical protein
LTSPHDIPATFVIVSVCCGDKITNASLKTFRSTHLDADDTFQPAFLSNIVFYGDEETDADPQPSAVSLLATWNTKRWHFVKSADEKNGIAPGPYVSYRGRIWEPRRIYTDDTLSMMVSFKPTGDGGTNGYALPVVLDH